MANALNRREAIRAVAGTTAVLGAARAARAGEPDLQTAEDKAHCEWLTGIIRQTETIRVGMRREDVEKVLNPDLGGDADPKAMRYQHPVCSYVKVDVWFELAESGDRARDSIIRRSMPLLDLIPNKDRH